MTEKYLLYVGKDKGTVPGVPSRDLTYEEAKEFDVIHLIQSGLYVYNFAEAIPEQFKKDLNLDPSITEEKPKKKKRKVNDG